MVTASNRGRGRSTPMMLKYHYFDIAYLDSRHINTTSINLLPYYLELFYLWCTYLPTYNYDDTREYVVGTIPTIVFAPLPAYFSDTGFGDYSWYSTLVNRDMITYEGQTAFSASHCLACLVFYKQSTHASMYSPLTSLLSHNKLIK